MIEVFNAIVVATIVLSVLVVFYKVCTHIVHITSVDPKGSIKDAVRVKFEAGMIKFQIEHTQESDVEE